MNVSFTNQGAFQKIACLLTGCRPVRVPFSDFKRFIVGSMSGTCVVPTLNRCARCGQVVVVD